VIYDNTIKVLFVDNAPSVDLIYQSVMDKDDYKHFEVYAASNGEEGVCMQREHSIKIIFSDIQMPIMNGYQMCREIKKMDPMAVIYAITGLPRTSAYHCREAGFDDFLEKPFTPTTVRAKVTEAEEKLVRWGAI